MILTRLENIQQMPITLITILHNPLSTNHKLSSPRSEYTIRRTEILSEHGVYIVYPSESVPVDVFGICHVDIWTKGEEPGGGVDSG